MFQAIAPEPYFATPVVRFKVADHQALDRALLQHGHQLRSQSEGVQKSNRGGWHSEGNFFDDDAACCKNLKQIALSATMEAVARCGATVDLKTLGAVISGWMNINGRGAFNAPHTHPDNHWSGVYYVAQPSVTVGTSGMIEFLDPRSDLPAWQIFKADTFRGKRKLRPAAGEMVLFPSFLSHWVYPNDTDDERVTIAFNVRFWVKNEA